MAHPCILHTHRYRAVYEGLVNSLTATGLSGKGLAFLRAQQSKLCSCEAPLHRTEEESDENLTQAINDAVDADSLLRSGAVRPPAGVEEEGWMKARPEPFTAAKARWSARGAVAAALRQLVQLAGKHCHLSHLAPSIRHAGDLLENALAVRGSMRSSSKRKVMAPRAGGYPPRSTHNARSMRSTRQPAKMGFRVPTGPLFSVRLQHGPSGLRWPPLAVTLKALRASHEGAPAHAGPSQPPQPPAASAAAPAAGGRVFAAVGPASPVATSCGATRGVAASDAGCGRALPLPLGDLLDWADRLQRQLEQRAHRKRRASLGRLLSATSQGATSTRVRRATRQPSSRRSFVGCTARGGEEEEGGQGSGREALPSEPAEVAVGVAAVGAKVAEGVAREIGPAATGAAASGRARALLRRGYKRIAADKRSWDGGECWSYVY